MKYLTLNPEEARREDLSSRLGQLGIVERRLFQLTEVAKLPDDNPSVLATKATVKGQQIALEPFLSLIASDKVEAVIEAIAEARAEKIEAPVSLTPVVEEPQGFFQRLISG